MSAGNSHTVRLLIPGLLLLQITCAPISAQNGREEEKDRPSAIIPGPEPFSLDAWSAQQCIDLLRETLFLEVKDDKGQSEIVKIEKAWSFFLGLNENYPEGYRRRYDIIINGIPLDWDNSYIEYGGEMINLRLLFLYRNQHPPGNLQYRNNPD